MSDVSQAWFADDASAVGSLSSLLTWWQHLSSAGPDYGYFTNAAKTVLIVKPKYLCTAQATFAGTNVQITARGLALHWGQEILLKSMWLQRLSHGLQKSLLWLGLLAAVHTLHTVHLCMVWWVVGSTL